MNKLLQFTSTGKVIILPTLLVCLLIPARHDTVLAASPIYVDADAAGGDGSSWDEAYTNLQTALAAATAGDQIWVAEGVYKPGNLRTSAFILVNDVAIYGGFDGTETALDQRDWESNVTVLSGDVDNNDTTDANGVVTTTAHIVGSNAYQVVGDTGSVSAATRLDGLIITGGKADGSAGYATGGGMYNHGHATLSNVIFSGNWARVGGGLYNNYGYSPLTNIIFANNTAEYDGGGMYNMGHTALANVTFNGNSAGDQGGGLYSDSIELSLANVSFSGNLAAEGGGIYNIFGDPTLANVTFSGNSADYGGGMYNYYGDPTLVNAIMWDNVAGTAGNQIYNASSTPTISYSLIQLCGGSGGGWNPSLGVDGGGNIDTDPLFVDADGPDDIAGTPDDNVHLQNTSPAIDAGDSTSVPADIGDLDGDGNTTEMLPYDRDNHPRFADMPVTDTGFGPVPIVDMGVYETNTAPIADAGAPQTVDTEATVALDGSGSSDPDGHALAYQWTQTGGTFVTLSDPSAVAPTFTAPVTAGNLTFELTVTDAYGLADSDTVTITVGTFYVYMPLVLR
jgi:predicted outer membrane repeat protein